jgi:hypothetical protein
MGDIGGSEANCGDGCSTNDADLNPSRVPWSTMGIVFLFSLYLGGTFDVAKARHPIEKL